jgi:hypothetical protein
MPTARASPEMEMTRPTAAGSLLLGPAHAPLDGPVVEFDPQAPQGVPGRGHVPVELAPRGRTRGRRAASGTARNPGSNPRASRGFRHRTKYCSVGPILSPNARAWAVVISVLFTVPLRGKGSVCFAFGRPDGVNLISIGGEGDMGKGRPAAGPLSGRLRAGQGADRLQQEFSSPHGTTGFTTGLSSQRPHKTVGNPSSCKSRPIV